MARPKKAIVDYFPHFVNSGKSMFTLEMKYGNDGYSFWFKLLEILGSSEHHYLNCNDISTWEFLLAKTRLCEDVVLSILDLLSKLNCINAELWKNKIIRSDNFIENLSVVYKRREVNVLNNTDVIGLCIQKLPLSGVSDDINPQSKVKDSKVKESKELLFLECWKLFGSYGSKTKALEYWNKLSIEDTENIKVRIPIYLNSLTISGFSKKQFQGWINPKNRIWETTYENTPIKQIAGNNQPQQTSFDKMMEDRGNIRSEQNATG